MLASRADGWLMKATHRFSRERKYAGNEATKLLVVADEVQEEKERRLKKVSSTVVHPLKSALLEERLEDVKEPKVKEPTDAIVDVPASSICETYWQMIRGT